MNERQEKLLWKKRQCCIKGCTTVAGEGIPLHRFPREEDMLLKWLDATDIKVVSLHTIICGQHFQVSDYINLGSKKRMLKRNIIPSLNLQNQNVADNHICIDKHLSEEDTDSAEDVSDNLSVDCDSENHESEKEDNNMLEQIAEKLVSIKSESETVNEINSQGKVITEEKENDCEIGTDEDIQAKVKMCETSAQTEKYSFMTFMKNDTDLRAFTGISFCTLQAIIKCASLIYKNNNDKHVCSLTERVVLVLCKLKLNLSFECLCVLFAISKSTASNYFFETIPLLAAVLEEAVYFPDQEEIQENIPKYLQNFQDTRIVLDCTEVAVENTKCLKCRLKIYSHYKGRQTLKVLIGITPSGLISFCSKCYGGRASDKTIFLQSGLLDKLIPNVDAVMVDKGFLIQSECEKRNIKVYRPPFANQNDQMTFEDTVKTRGIAAARVHVERAIQRLKTYSILKSTIPWEMTKYMDQIFLIICGLKNLSSPIISKTRYSNEM